MTFPDDRLCDSVDARLRTRQQANLSQPGFSLVGLPWAALLLGLAWPSAGTVRVPYRIG